jgi:site-specific recombinase XerD
MNTGNYQRQLSDWMKYKRYSPKSISNYTSCIGKFLQYFENEATKPSEISADRIKKFLTTKTKTNTHRAYLCAIKLFYTKVGHQPRKLDDIEYPRSEKKLPIVLSQDEIQKMFDVCENIKHKVILALLYSCGLRVSELLNLEWKHIDRSRMIINIIHGKGAKDRQVFLPKPIIPLLEKYYKEYHPKQYILNGQFDIKYSQQSILQVVKQLSEKAGIKKRVYTHLIRHCCFTHLVEGGTDINLIQKIAGHQNVKTTMIYCHLSDNLISKIQSPINSMRIAI